MAVHVVVPEGLARAPGLEAMVLSPHFEAVLSRVAGVAAAGEQVYMSPGNSFGNAVSEEVVAADRLRTLRPDLAIVVPRRPEGHRYLDTLDNARELRLWLEARGAWPLPPIRLYCYGRHGFRSRLVFRWEGYAVERLDAVLGAAPKPRPLRRLWYMGVPGAHEIYEGVATIYDAVRAVPKILGGGR